MVRHAPERVLLIGDSQRQVHTALSQALPGAQITSVQSVFDGIAELSSNSYSAVLAAAEPIERRPEPAVRTLRQLAGEGRLLLFGHPTLEILSRKMLQFGCDDYIITPPNPQELQRMFVKPPMRLADAEPTAPTGRDAMSQSNYSPPSPLKKLADLPVAEIILEAMLQYPHDSATAALRVINDQISPHFELRLVGPGTTPEQWPQGYATRSHSLLGPNGVASELFLLAQSIDDEPAAQRALEHIAAQFGKLASLQDRHNRLQKLAIMDDLTGLYNARYFRHFLGRIMERARNMRFPVTLLLFDIDDFKKYNDQYGHGAGDDILKQTAQLMRRCCREHDLVARIGGDEFAVVFWDKEGPRQPLDPSKPLKPSRPPQTPLQIFERFKRLAASSDFSGLGASGRGRLSVSGGLAVYPYDAQDVAGLIKAADDYLMFKAKKAGKNSVYLVEGQENGNSTH